MPSLLENSWANLIIDNSITISANYITLMAIDLPTSKNRNYIAKYKNKVKHMLVSNAAYADYYTVISEWRV